MAHRDSKLTAIVFVLQILIPTVLSQVVTSNVTNQNVCSGDVITFNCSTTGSGGIAWISNEYIGTGSQLEFNINDAVGDVLTSHMNPDVVATFIRNDVDDSGNPLLRSQLILTISSKFLVHTVICVYSSDRSRIHEVRLHTLAVPEMPLEMISNQTVDAKGTCTLHLSWRPPVNIDSEDLSHYMIHIDGENVVNKTHTVTNTSSLQQFAYPLCTCGDHTVSIQAVSRCERAGSKTESVRVAPSRLLPPTCDAQTTQPICTAQNDEIISLRKEVKRYKSEYTGTTIFLCLVIVVLGGVIFALVFLVVLHVKDKKYIKELEDKIKKIKNNVNEDEVKVKEDEEKIKELENKVKEDEDKIKQLEEEINGPIKAEVDIEDSRIQNKAGTDHEEITKVTDVETEVET